MTPLIGLTVAIDKDGHPQTLAPYCRAIEAAGGLPLLLPYVSDGAMLDAFIDRCDGIFLTGGMEIEPARYGEEKRPTCGETQPLRDEVELAVLARAIKADKPILAICRGAQLVNVFFGGTLYQDLPTEYPSDIPHRQPNGIFAPSHCILIEKNTPLAATVRKREMVGNSFHHQAIHRLGEGLVVMATAEDGTVEAVFAPALSYLRAYQWHPERLYAADADNRLLFADFIEAASKKQ
jgi:putative glutamine amidotransferase